ncbi:MAG: UDP-N-acetylglucosamine--N-acetylmuramyl-(pentapeptide) pyrophosphoryl-undecaprenol N-acetylglucosamine transferase [Anaerohalosphaeraceae bacterium]
MTLPNNLPSSQSHPSPYIFFAGGGTGGHLYPALAVAEQVRLLEPNCQMTFFCSSRAVDARVLGASGYDFLPLPAEGLGLSPRKFARFYAGFIKSYYFVKQILASRKQNAIVVGTGGFVCAPVVFAARSLKIPVYLINVDIVPGKANRLLGRLSKKIFVQFYDTLHFFKPDKAMVTGCPLRSGFYHPDRSRAIESLKLDPSRQTLLVTGASSGSRDINNAIMSILPQLRRFADQWQIVHLTGQANYQAVAAKIQDSPISYIPVEYVDEMPDLYAASDLIIGRSGAVSVAEYAAAGKPSICIPYPYHKDNHQYLNAQQLSRRNAAVIVCQDLKNPARFSQNLCKTLIDLMSNPSRRREIALSAQECAAGNAAETIAKSILGR